MSIRTLAGALCFVGLATGLAACAGEESDGEPGDAGRPDAPPAAASGGQASSSGGAPSGMGGSAPGGANGTPAGGTSGAGGAPGSGGESPVVDGGVVSCDPRRAVCRRSPPICAEGRVPAIVGTCYGGCVPIDQCPCSEPADCPSPDQFTCHNFRQRCGYYLN